jgi:hypothetical protein
MYVFEVEMAAVTEELTENFRNERVIYDTTQPNFIKIKNIFFYMYLPLQNGFVLLFILYKNITSFISRSESDFEPWSDNAALDTTEPLSKTDVTKPCLNVHTSTCAALPCLCCPVLPYSSLPCTCISMCARS